MRLLKNPMVLFALFMLSYSAYRTFSEDLSYIIRSDGRGYYAYLPALIVFNDPSFEASAKAENEYHEKKLAPLHLVKSHDGEVHNKYFPGVAVLQAPFFVIATAVSWLANQPIDGYSDIYSVFFYFGSIFYVILGLLFFYKVLKALFPKNHSSVLWIIPLFYFATPLFHYSVHTPSFGHLYSFFLFTWFSWTVIKLKEYRSGKRFLILGLILGLIVIVRPTNVFIVSAIPLLLGDYKTVKNLFRSLNLNYLLQLFIGFFSTLALLFLVWKWESGNWIVWSYSGEGFNFLNPKLIDTLFSFRIGLLIHTPIVLLAIFSGIILFRKNSFQASFWTIYFIINTWIIASWWCWDYESPFGNRPFTEHLFFLLLPLFTLLIKKNKLIVGLSVVFTLIGILRLWSYSSGHMPNQRFTSSNYITSLAVWNDDNYNRWNYTRSCRPYGERIQENVLLNDTPQTIVEPNQEFICSVIAPLAKPRTNERFYYRVELEKRISQKSLSGVFLVIDAINKSNGQRYYHATELMNDRQEGKGNWAKLLFEGTLHDSFQEYDNVKIYIWNPERQTFSVRRVKITLDVYKS